MKKKVQLTQIKELNKLFKDSFKRKLTNQIEAKIITPKQAQLKYGVSNSVLSDWKSKFGTKALMQSQQQSERIVAQTEQHKADIKFWREFQAMKSELEIYKTLISLAKSRYKLDLKKNFGLKL